METPSGIIKEKDFKYNGKDAGSFLRCCACGGYTPFIFYITSRAALAAARMHPKYNYFCVECLPKPASNDASDASSMYAQGSLLRNEQFLRLFVGFKYYNPYYQRYAGKNRLIITEESKIHQSFKKMLRKPMPTEAKLEKIYKLFLPVHQLSCKKYGTLVEMYDELRQKYREISSTYHEMELPQEFFDNFDLMIERTPLQTQQTRDRSQNATDLDTFPSDSQQLRTGDSDEAVVTSNAVSMEISSELLVDNSQNSALQLTVVPSATNSEFDGLQSQRVRGVAIDISSQDIRNVDELPVLNVTPSSGELSSISSVLVAPSSKELRGYSSSQVAGPSGLQRQREETTTFPIPKRRRIYSTPVNPSPKEVQSSRSVEVRLPRLNGG
ncbi:uncharacterized protein LOC128709566 [Anopheles marshallii]|uniref:uncharacterized protein LOC128709566 n=1 Tax=Anopheles marshallii TaxID=1521116 RepID=UPI00237C109D|nr:uncharacterized protein LOC128709566 [Anopheles marshallii]